VLNFKQIMEALPEGFKAMVPAILILTFAWSLKAMTDSLGAKEFVAGLVKNSAGAFTNFLPAIVFIIACGLAFATGTSWGTFGILIPITLAVFPLTDPLGVVCVSACMAGAVCGDHCSPISDTTIMASAGAQCNHVNHVSTQLPYAITVAAVSFVAYIIAGFVPVWYVVLPIAIVLMIVTLILMKKLVFKNSDQTADAVTENVAD
ncbi:MAG: Na+/H+ antiporter NhaC family protein, partial [Clostridia bacterium]|nr:Na+/H+ antiporter NhaC family protein [Clostridia bacterium]